MQQLADFLDVPITAERAQEIARLCSLSVMKAAEEEMGLMYGGSVIKRETGMGDGSLTEPCARQVRSGGVGGWKTYFSPELEEVFDEHHRKEMSRHGAVETAGGVAGAIITNSLSGGGEDVVQLPIQWT